MSNLITQAKELADSQWFESNPWAAARGIDESTWIAICTTIFPGAKQESVRLAVDYCQARRMDVMLKPVHLVPMRVKDAQTGKSEFRDVPMPGIGLYRIQADRSGSYAGADEPEFGPIVEGVFNGTDYNKNPIAVTVKYPEWCKYTVYKMIGGQRVSFSAKEYWLENYATQSASSEAPNSMWKKRVFGQLAKCTEAQALRKAWPEIGQDVTAEEMAGKEYIIEHDITPQKPERPAIEYYPAESFEQNFPAWRDAIESGKATPERIIKTVSSRATLTDDQKKAIEGVVV